MTDTYDGEDLEPVVEEQADTTEIEDRDYDTLDEAADAFSDDDDDIEEQPEEAEAQEEEAEDEAESESVDAVIELPDGTELTVSELEDLRASGLRLADYTKKTTEVAKEREAITAEREALSQRVEETERALQAAQSVIQTLVPPAPTYELFQRDPQAYEQQKMLYEAAKLQIVQPMMQAMQQLQGKRSEISEDEVNRYRKSEDEKLVKAMPHLSDPAKRHAFDKDVKEVALDFGFTEDEIAQTADSRILQLVHYARLGKRAEHNRNNAKRRVETPKAGTAKRAKVPAQVTKNREAMRRLSKSGSLNDALEIDFE